MSGSGQSSNDQQILSHVVKRLLKREGGEVAVSTVQLRTGDYVDITPERVAELLEDGDGQGVYTVSQQPDGNQVIISVSPVGPEPKIIGEAFGDRNAPDDLTTVEGVDQEVANALWEQEGIDSIETLAETEAETIKDGVDEYRKAQAESFPWADIAHVTSQQADALDDAGFETAWDVADENPATVADVHNTLTAAKVEQLQEMVEAEVNRFPEGQADTIAEAAETELPIANLLARKSRKRYLKMAGEDGRASAIITDTNNESETVGDQLSVVRSSLDEDDEKAQYMAGLGANQNSPQRTGFQIHQDTGYSKIPRPADHEEATDEALPVDENGDVIPPTVPNEPRLQLPMDEIIAKKLARGVDAPVRIEGPPGSGKNYTLKYLCWATNRGYRSIDVGKTTTPEDLFGPLTPNEDRQIVARNGPVKQGLINGDIVVINEFPTMPAGVAMDLHRFLNDGKLLVKAHGELIEPHPAARIVITMNPPTREFRDSEPMNRATRGRFRGVLFGYPDDVDEETETVHRQVNTPRTVLKKKTLRTIVNYAHQTRENDNWPTLSTRNLVIVAEHIADGASPRGAVKNELWAVAEPNDAVSLAEEAVSDTI
jgi:nitric oxide reductase NorQ protein